MDHRVSSVLALLLLLVTATAPLTAAPTVKPAPKKPVARAAPAPLQLDPGSPRDTPLAKALSAEVRQGLRVAPALGVAVSDLADGTLAFAFNGDTPRILASNTKLLTTAAALDTLGPGYHFETWLFGRGPVGPDGVLTGDLAAIGGGDPTISERQTGDPYHAFRAWADELHARGIRTVAGDLYLVHGFFEDETIHPDWPKDQLARWYEAPVSALSFNDNCVQVRVWPTRGAQARVDLLPRVDLLDVQNFTRIGANPRQQQLVITREPESAAIAARGQIFRNGGPADFWVTVPDGVMFFGAALKAALAEEGITVLGTLKPVKRLPVGAWERYAVHRSNLLTALAVINKHSQNFYAESLLKTLGAEACQEGTWEGGLRQVAEFLDRLGIRPGSYEMSDGSGMSRNNRFTPNQLLTLLGAMHQHRWAREFLLSLPFSGEEDLGWERRLAQPPYRGNVFAKTGTLNGVSTLSGYAKARSGRLYAFSVLCNQARSVAAARAAQDRIVRALIDNG